MYFHLQLIKSLRTNNDHQYIWKYIQNIYILKQNAINSLNKLAIIINIYGNTYKIYVFSSKM